MNSWSPTEENLPRRRLERLRDHLEERSIDWLLLLEPANIAYATGYRSVSGALSRGHRMAALVSREDLWMVAPCADAGPALEAGLVADERYVAFGRFYFESADGGMDLARFADQHSDFDHALAAALGSLPAGNHLFGTDSPSLVGSGGHSRLEAVEDVGGWMLEVRSTKLPGEIELLARAASLAEAGIDAGFSAAKPGVTERDIVAIVSSTMVLGGGDPRFCVVTFGERSALADARPTDRALRPGDIVRMDVGCVVSGYWSDLGRTGVCGDPTREQRERYRALLAGEAAQLDFVRPGVQAQDVFQVAVDTVESEGLRPYRRHHCGHAIGSEVYERPVIAPGETTPLREGMVFCFETPFYELGWGGMMVEDTLVVTAEGCRLLSHSERNLRVLGE